MKLRSGKISSKPSSYVNILENRSLYYQQQHLDLFEKSFKNTHYDPNRSRTFVEGKTRRAKILNEKFCLKNRNYSENKLGYKTC